MHRSTKTKKRLVTKGEFIAKTGEKAALASFGTIIGLIGILCLLLTCIGLINVVGIVRWSDLLPCLFGVGMLGAASCALVFYGGKAVKEGKAIDAGVPLTRANTGDLPAAESLVRASQEPLQRQEAVLLRASLQDHATPPEEMVRASTQPEVP